jgi:hypothetical protein
LKESADTLMNRATMSFFIFYFLGVVTSNVKREVV